MEEFRIDLTHDRNTKFFGRNISMIKLFYIQSFFFFVLGLLQLFSDSKYNGILSFALALMYGIGAYVQNIQTKKVHVILNDSFADFYLSKWNQIKVDWKDVSVLSLSPISIHFRNSKDTVNHIDLGSLSYVNVRLLKEKLREFAEAKNIEVH